jgi:hypothetical protein
MPWQRFAVPLRGHDEPVEVQTTARDWANVQVDPAKAAPMDMMFRVVHVALRRTRAAEIPISYDEFLDDELDGMPEALDGETPLASAPTTPAPSDAPR